MRTAVPSFVNCHARREPADLPMPRPQVQQHRPDEIHRRKEAWRPRSRVRAAQRTRVFGTLRLQNRPGLDDNCDMKGRVDEAGEVSGLNSVGAFDSACSCSAPRPVIF